jgi:hypothetical protein
MCWMSATMPAARVRPANAHTDWMTNEISPTSLVHTCKADQWASCNAARSPTVVLVVVRGGGGDDRGVALQVCI